MLLPWNTVCENGDADKKKPGAISALIRPVPAFGLPQPVAKSYPTVAG